MAIFYFEIITVLIIDILLFEFYEFSPASANNISEEVFHHTEIYSQNQSYPSPVQSSYITRGMNKVFEQFFKSYAAKRRAHLTKMLPRSTRSTSTSTSLPIDPAARMIWLDMELTGLDLESDTIMEIACVITEGDLNIVAQAPTFIIHRPKEVLDKMVPWCQQQHTKTGLIEECLKSNTTVEEADEQLYNFVKKYVPEGKGCVAGNSVYMDKWFVIKYLPKLNAHLHYRLIDVSTLKELCRRWRNDDYKKVPKKAYVHRALDDIMESIDELKHYKKIIFDK